MSKLNIGNIPELYKYYRKTQKTHERKHTRIAAIKNTKLFTRAKRKKHVIHASWTCRLRKLQLVDVVFFSFCRKSGYSFPRNAKGPTEPEATIVRRKSRARTEHAAESTFTCTFFSCVFLLKPCVCVRWIMCVF